MSSVEINVLHLLEKASHECDGDKDRARERSEVLKEIGRMCTSLQIREMEFREDFYRLVAEVVRVIFGEEIAVAEDEKHAIQLLDTILTVAEFNAVTAASSFNASFVASLCTAFCVGQDLRLERSVHLLYHHFPKVRPIMRRRLGSELRLFITMHVNPVGYNAGVRAAQIKPAAIVAPILRIITTIVKGFQMPLSHADVSLLFDVIVPLHSPFSMETVTSPTIALYHEALVRCIYEFVTIDHSLLARVTGLVLRDWPVDYKSNTPKEVLLLHELETLVSLFRDLTEFRLVADSVYAVVCGCLNSLNSRVAERAVMFWKCDKFLAFLHEDAARAWPILIRALLRDKQVHWSTTVNKMTAVVLTDMRAVDPERFEFILEGLCGDELEPAAWFESFLDKLDLERLRPVGPVGPVEGESKSGEPIARLDLAGKRKQRITTVPEQINGLHFHSFVFGLGELGSGSFATVRYAKRIVKSTSASHWLEYAVKEIDTALVIEQHYEENLKREVEVMNAASHPNITRLIATFNRSEKMYLVLEYCKRGDLHGLITSKGTLDINTTAFLMGEMVVALAFIHDMGVLFNDFKPENVLLHETGHAKLADFGSACYMKDVGSHHRLEGTAEYLAPELVSGGQVSVASDTWALGCTVFYCLAGRLPIFAADEAALLDRIVKFAGVGDEAFFPKSFPEPARLLVSKLLTLDPAERLRVTGVDKSGLRGLLHDPFFASLDLSIPLHDQTPPEYSVGTVAPPVDKRWTRRANSIMHAPMPAQYDLSHGAGALAEETVLESELERDVSWERALDTVREAEERGDRRRSSVDASGEEKDISVIAELHSMSRSIAAVASHRESRVVDSRRGAAGARPRQISAREGMLLTGVMPGRGVVLDSRRDKWKPPAMPAVDEGK